MPVGLVRCLSDKRQKAAIAAFTRANGFELVAEYYDQAVSGAASSDRAVSWRRSSIAANGVRTIIVESPDRFARDLTVQLAGHDMLKA